MQRRNIFADFLWVVVLLALAGLVAIAYYGENPLAVYIAAGVIGLGILVPIAINLPSLLLGQVLPPVWRVARATFHEALRRRFLNGILIFASLIILSSWVLAYLQPGAELKLLIDVGLGSIRFFGLLIAVFLGTRLIAEEIERRTIHTLLAKPVSRAQFLLGKFFGGYATVLANVVVMAIAFYIVFAIKAPQFRNIDPETGATTYEMEYMHANIIKALGLSFAELAVVVALAVTASTVFTWVLAAVFSFFVYFVGQMSDFFRSLSAQEQGVQPVARIILGTIYRVLPHFDMFDIRENIIKDELVPWSVMTKHGLLALLYIVVIMLIGYLFFNEREV